MGLFRRRSPEEPVGPSVVLDEQRLHVRRSRGFSESVAWDDIAMIRVVVEAPEGEAPAAFLVLGDLEQTAGCVVPAAHAPAELTEWVVGLPGFDRAAYDRALLAEGGEPVTVWLRP